MATTTRVLTASVNGTVYTTNANGALEAIDTCHSGATAPTNEVANGKLWLDTTTTPGILKMYNNAAWEVIGGSTSSPTFTNGTFTGDVFIGDDLWVTGPNPVITLTDTDVADEYGKFWHTSGNNFFTARNGAVNGQHIFYQQAGAVVSEAMRIDENGRLGLGVINPTEQLHVSGNSGTTVKITDTSASAAGPTLLLERQEGTSFTDDVIGNIDFYSGDFSSGGASVRARISAAHDDEYNAAGLRFYTVQHSGSVADLERMRIDASGNVGIGTDSPTEKLDVVGDVILSDTGTTTTDTRKLSVHSNGYAVLELSGDRDNPSGEPGGSGATFGVDGAGANAVVSFVNAAGGDGVGGTYTGTTGNDMLIGTNTSQPIHFGINRAVVATLGTDGVFSATLAGDGSALTGIYGQGQTLQDMSASRVSGTSYRNTTGKTIFVGIEKRGGGGFFHYSTNNSTWIEVAGFPGSVGSYEEYYVGLPIPHNTYYRISSGGYERWTELR